MKKWALLLGALVVLLFSLFFLWRHYRQARTIPVGMVAWMASGAVVGSSELHAGDLFL